MTTDCADFRRKEEMTAADWAVHLASCPDCQKDEATERLLRGTFAQTPRPALPGDFTARVQAATRARQGLYRSAWQVRLVRLYVLAAMLASGLVVATIDWPQSPGPAVVAMLLFAAALVVLPVVLLQRLARTSLFVLLEVTLDW